MSSKVHCSEIFFYYRSGMFQLISNKRNSWIVYFVGNLCIIILFTMVGACCKAGECLVLRILNWSIADSYMAQNQSWSKNLFSCHTAPSSANGWRPAQLTESLSPSYTFVSCNNSLQMKWDHTFELNVPVLVKVDSIYQINIHGIACFSEEWWRLLLSNTDTCHWMFLEKKNCWRVSWF